MDVLLFVSNCLNYYHHFSSLAYIFVESAFYLPPWTACGYAAGRSGVACTDPGLSAAKKALAPMSGPHSHLCSVFRGMMVHPIGWLRPIPSLYVEYSNLNQPEKGVSHVLASDPDANRCLLCQRLCPPGRHGRAPRGLYRLQLSRIRKFRSSAHKVPLHSSPRRAPDSLMSNSFVHNAVTSHP